MRGFKTFSLTLKIPAVPLFVATLLALQMGTANAVLMSGIHGYKYNDLDGDGNFDSNEGPLGGTSFELLNDNGDVIDSESSDASGQFWFMDLIPGTYSVRENPIPDGYALTTLPNERTFNVSEGEHLVHEDGAAMLPVGTGEFESNLGDELRWGNALLSGIYGYKFDDLDGDGNFDPEDGPLAGTTFLLLDELATVIASTISDASGQFWFMDLSPGTYSVQENPIPDGYALTTLPNERTFNVGVGEYLVYADGVAGLPVGTGLEINLGDELRWGNTAIPEPATVLLMGLGLAGLGFARRRRLNA